jgi:type VI secretion system protein
MREDRLLDRIRAWERDPARRGVEDPQRLNDSILSHLQRILNTRQGSVPIADDYGIPDFNEYLQVGGEAVRELEKVLRATIQKYEPRLKGARVIFVPQEEERLNLRFQVSARLAGDTKSQVQFETTIDSDGKIRLKD